MNVRSRTFPLVDSMRAIAFLCVFVSHAGFFAFYGDNDWALRPYVARLDVGVRIFFLISAFLLYRPFVAARLQASEPPATRAYAWRRLLRIAPPYWLALIVVGIWLGAPEVFTWGHAPFYFGFAHVYRNETLSVQALPQAWSLCVEAAFYVMLPLYAALLRRRGGGLRTELVGAAALFGLSLAYKLAVLAIGGPFSDPSLLPWHFALPEFLDYFAIGIALAALSVGAHERLERAVRRPWLLWLGALVAFVFVSKGIGLSGGLHDRFTDPRYLAQHYLYAAVALLLFLPAVAGEGGVVRRVLAWRPLLWIGLVSYGAFLYHFAFLTQLGHWGFNSFANDRSPYIWFPVGLAAALAIAAVSWYAFERPLLELKRLVPGSAGRREDRERAVVEEGLR